MIKRLLIVSVLVVAIVGAIGYYKLVFEPDLIRQIISNSPMPTVTVSAAPAQEETWRQRVAAIGTVRATRGIEVTSEVAGRVVSANFESGQDVEAGEALVQLDDATEQAQLKSDLATLKSAQLTFERQTQLFKTRAASRAALDDAVAARDQAQAAVELTRATIAKKRITAPFAGRLGVRLVDPGQYVTPGTAFAALQALDPIFVDFPVPEQEFRLLKKGQTVEVRTDAFPEETFTGEVGALDSRVSRDTRSILVRALLPNSDTRLLPGMFANVEVIAGEPETVITVPATAVTYSLYGNTIFVLTPEEAPEKNGGAAVSESGGGAISAARAQEGGGEKGAGNSEAPEDTRYKVERRIVKVGPSMNGSVQITEGLNVGELVATAGQNKLQGGMVVRIDNSDQLAAPSTPPRG